MSPQAIPDGGPAFPLKRDPEQKPIGAATLAANEARAVIYENRDQLGMSLRDYFAAQVLNMASHDLTDPGEVAQRCYVVADAMLKERAK